MNLQRLWLFGMAVAIAVATVSFVVWIRFVTAQPGLDYAGAWRNAKIFLMGSVFAIAGLWVVRPNRR